VKAERPSRTAHFVAHGRALADAGLSHVPDFQDPTARVFLSENGKRSLAKTELAAREGTRGIGVDMARVMADMIALRTGAIEVDHPATQGDKRAHLAELPPLPPAESSALSR
jgi:O-methyltransferase involved in polyketide biosynthesis